ncbi:MAG: putative metalloprotease, contains C-terminal domain [Rhodospirillales bacterium]|nr:putative metalloprotease, contains C-terminal domain [Rhodospirillales bacterium]
MKRSLLLALAAGTCLAAPAFAADAPALQIELRPFVENGLIAGFDVEERVSQAPAAITIPVSIGPLLRIADRVTGLTVKDAQGAIGLTPSDEPVGVGPMSGMRRVWKLVRAPSGDITITYRVVVSKETASGPSYELRSEAKGISGSGQAFLVLPDDKQAYKIGIAWDGLPAGGQGLTSFPAGDQALPLDRLRNTYFMAGKIDTTPKDPSKAGAFRAASTVDIDDPDALLDWTSHAYTRMYPFFGHPTEPPFTVMFRTNPFGSTSGTAGPTALLAVMSKNNPVQQVHDLVTHEMVHVFITGLDGQTHGGWFTEGTAVHYERRFQLVAGLATPKDFLNDLNSTMRRYYSNVRNDIPMKDAIDAFWSDARGRVLPYDRGSIYFGDMDAKIRAASKGKRSLDNLIREFYAARREGKPGTLEAWLDLVSRDLPNARADFQAMMDGKVIVPPSNAFGPCFKRVAADMPSFELGFAQTSLTKYPRVITDLDPASPAARAGLHNGDKVIAPVYLDRAQATPSEPINMTVDRDGQTLAISFKPEGAKRKGYLWERVKGVPDAKCASS